MSKATNTVLKIEKAVEKYGSAIKIRTITKGAYDPRDPTGNDTVVDVAAKGIFKKSMSQDLKNIVPENILQTFEKIILINADFELSKVDNRILYDNVPYEIVFISDPILQDVTLYYELLIQK